MDGLCRHPNLHPLPHRISATFPNNKLLDDFRLLCDCNTFLQSVRLQKKRRKSINWNYRVRRREQKRPSGKYSANVCMQKKNLYRLQSYRKRPHLKVVHCCCCCWLFFLCRFKTCTSFCTQVHCTVRSVHTIFIDRHCLHDRKNIYILYTLKPETSNIVRNRKWTT